MIYFLAALVSGVGFLTQILVSGFWSTAFSQDVTFYSINLAFYFLSLGIGSLLARRWKKPGMGLLLGLAFAQCIWMGLSISLLRWAIFRFNQATPFAVFTVCIAGLLAGTFLPLAVEVGRKKRMDLGRLFFAEYSAAIVFALVVQFGLLIPLGYSRSTLAVATVCGIGVLMLGHASLWRHPWVAIATILALVLPWQVDRGARHLSDLQAGSSDTQVLWARQSHYQKIVLTQSTSGPGTLFPGLPQVSLYLDGFVQFSSGSEPAYHFCIANFPATAASSSGTPVRRALILGGGDGLAARNLLAWPGQPQIDLVELDPLMIELARTDPRLKKINLDALSNPRVKVTIADAFRWVQTATPGYDIILIDLPSPKNLGLARLFTAEFYRRVERLLTPGGFVAIQAGPYFAPHDSTQISTLTSAIRHTVQAVGLRSWIYYTPRDQDAFVLATKNPDFSMEAFSRRVGVLHGGPLSGICAFNPQMREPATAVNTLNTLSVARHAMDWYQQNGGTGFFFYGNAYGVFLPD